MTATSLRHPTRWVPANLLQPVFRSRTGRLAVAALCGALLGLLVYGLRDIEDRVLYLLVGALVAAAIAAVVELYRRHVDLTEVKISLPQVSQLTFVVDNDAKHTAWELFVEVTTRVSTQPLGAEEGFLREALNSLYSLFGRTRELLAKSRPTVGTGGNTVESLALAMLNRELRPFLSKWHPRLARFEQSGERDETTWEDNAAFREELEAMRRRLIEYAVSFAELAGVRDAPSMIHPQPSALK